MKRKSPLTPQKAKNKFLKRVLSYIFTLIIISVIYFKFSLPGFVYFIIVLSLTYGLAKKYIDYRPYFKNTSSESDPLLENADLLQREPLKSKKPESLEKEWKDSDFV